MTSTRQYELRIELLAYDGASRHASYDEFGVGPETTNYTLLVGKYTGDAGKYCLYNVRLDTLKLHL